MALVRVSPEDDARFERELPHSMAAVYAVAEHLRAHGNTIEVICNTTYKDRWTYKDRPGDLLANGYFTIEVKHRREFDFMSRDEFPHRTMIVDRATKKSGLCNLYVSVNRDCTAALFLSAKTREHWIVENKEDHQRGYPPLPVLLCPKEFAEFRILERRHEAA